MPPETRLATARRLVRERVPFAVPAFRAAMTVLRFLTGGPRRLASEARQVAAYHGLAGAAEHLAAQALVECQRFPPLEREFLGDALLPSGSAAGSARLADRLRRRSARAGLELLDLRFERAYQRLLADPRRPLLPASAFEAGGLLTTIGSLAPGGAERQLVSLLGGLAPRESRDLQVVGLFFDAPIKHFFRPQVDESRVRIAEIRRPPEFAEALLAEYPGDRAIAEFVAAQATAMPWELVEIWCYLLEMLERRPAVFHGWMDDCNVKGGIAAAIAGVPRIVLGTRSLAPDNFVLFQPFMRAAYRALLRLPQV
ncbi:MAG: hypothetical protein NDJ94_21985, partial [Vicinamibacteria bacterium]|nr:hypothetical protein [Vicinamibacteria bacterium]